MPSPEPTLAQLLSAIFPREIDMVGFARGGSGLPQSLLDRVSPDLEVEFLPRALEDPEPGQGLPALIQRWTEWLEPYDRYTVTIEEIREAGPDQALLLVHVQARTHRDQVEVEHRPANVMTARDGLLVRARFYLDRAEALAAVEAEG